MSKRRTLTFVLGSLWLCGCLEQPTSINDGDGNTKSSTSAQGGSDTGTTSGPTTSAGGATDGGSSSGGQTASFDVSLSDAKKDVELRATVDVDVTIASSGYAGDVELSLSGVPGDVIANLESTTVTLDGSSTETVKLTITTASDSTTGAYPISVVGTTRDGNASDSFELDVLPVITIHIPKNVSGFSANPANKTAFGDYPTVIKALPVMDATHTITVNFYNDDTVGHEIHADKDGEGFGHGNQSINPNSFDPVVRAVKFPGTYDYYPHDIGQSILGRIVIE